MDINWTVNVSDIVQIVLVFSGGVVVAVNLINGIKALTGRLDAHDGKFTKITTKLEQLQEMFILHAKHEERITNLSERMTRVEGRVYKE